MKVGSIVIMVEALDSESKYHLLKSGIKDWPEPCDRPLEVTELIKSSQLESGIGLGFDLYPELAKNFHYMCASMFREVQPPDGVNIAEVVEIANLTPA
jgi:hypothetical protein